MARPGESAHCARAGREQVIGVAQSVIGVIRPKGFIRIFVATFMNNKCVAMGKGQKKPGKTLDFKTVYECCDCLGCRTLHPLASIVNLEQPDLAEDAVKFEFYAVLVIEEYPGGCGCCGRKYYDYSEATMVFLMPGEIFRLGRHNALPPKGWLLAFHPDLLLSTTLKSHIGNYTFFSYHKEEALHLSRCETATVTCLLERIEEELHHAIDTHTGTILSRHIELLLDYCSRFYERQFITRENKNKALLGKLDILLRDYMRSGRLGRGQLPSASYCAAELGLSAAYLTDLLRYETGRTLDEHFCVMRLEAAKRMLAEEGRTPREAALSLGFPNVQYFSFVFKKVVGVSPGEYHGPRN